MSKKCCMEIVVASNDSYFQHTKQSGLWQLFSFIFNKCVKSQENVPNNLDILEHFLTLKQYQVD